MAFPAFRDAAEEAVPVSLVPYFGDARVTGWLAVHGTGAGDSPAAGAASRFGGVLSDMRAALGRLGPQQPAAERAAQQAAGGRAQSAAGQQRPVIRQAITQVCTEAAVLMCT